MWIGLANLPTAKVDTKKLPARNKSKLGVLIGVLEFLLEFCYDLIPNFNMIYSATSYCCL